MTPFLNRLRALKKAVTPRDVLIHVLVSASALTGNLRALRSLAPDWQIAPVLKSNAYGHGLGLVAHVFEKDERVPFFCVDSYFEAESLRAAEIRKDILVLGYTPASVIKQGRLRRVAFAVGALDDLTVLGEQGARVPLHLKFDTGMHRQGIADSDAMAAVALVQKHALAVDGILSHLADAATNDSPLTKAQIDRWNRLVALFEKELPAVRYYHLASSAGFKHAGTIRANIGRPGLAIYGFAPRNLNIAVKPTLRIETRIAAIRTVQKGEAVGYNGVYVAPKERTIATVPAGYAEGVDLRLSNKGSFLVGGHAAPIVGRVSMNISSCDVTGIQAKVGSTVTLVSDIPRDLNSVENIARLCDTIPYEILVHVPAHLRRSLVP